MQDIICGCNDKAWYKYVHVPQVFPGDLPLLCSVSSHPLLLPCLGDSFYAPCTLLLLMYFLNHKGMVLGWNNLEEFWLWPPLNLSLCWCSTFACWAAYVFPISKKSWNSCLLFRNVVSLQVLWQPVCYHAEKYVALYVKETDLVELTDVIRVLWNQDASNSTPWC